MRGGPIEEEIDYKIYDRKVGGGMLQLVCYSACDVYLNENFNDNKIDQIVKKDTIDIYLNENVKKDTIDIYLNENVKKDNVIIKTYKFFINFIMKSKKNNNYKPILEY